MLGSVAVKWGTCRICISVSMCVINQQRCPVVIYFIRQTLHTGGDMFARILHLVNVMCRDISRVGLLHIAPG